MADRNRQKRDLNFEERLELLPKKPGVYLMKNSEGEVVYVGKAKNLAKRVRSYFTGKRGFKNTFLMRNVSDIETIITINEQEALLLENNLIKKWKPRYNINLKDGKTYPVIRLTKEEYPRIFRTRRIVFDGSEYFGPYASANTIDIYLELIDRLFPLRKCRGRLKKREHPCLNYHIGKCKAPCTGRISKEDYLSMVENVRNLLAGKTKKLTNSLKKEMNTASEKLEFERAARLRDSLDAIEFISAKQNIIDFKKDKRDYIGYWSEENLISFAVLQSREGKLVGREIFSFSNIEDDSDALLQFLSQYYTSYHKGSTDQPDYIYIQAPIEKDQLKILFASYFTVKVIVPQKGKHAQTVKLAIENAREDVKSRKTKFDTLIAIEELKSILNLPKAPLRIEGFDIAHLGGEDTVASMVSFTNGYPDKSSYRHFKIHSLSGKIDDYEAIREVIARRYSRILNENLEKPDLIVIDGGKGQVNAAFAILESLDLSTIPIIGLAKKNEEIYLPNSGEPIILDMNSNALRLLIRIRDETHRFAGRLHKHLRRTRRTSSVLEAIPGVGEKRSKILLKAFGSIQEIRNSTPQEISEKTGFNLSLVSSILSHLSQLHSRKRAEQS